MGAEKPGRARTFTLSAGFAAITSSAPTRETSFNDKVLKNELEDVQDKKVKV